MTERSEAGKTIAAATAGGIFAAGVGLVTASMPVVWPVVLPAIAGAVGEHLVSRWLDDRQARTEQLAESVKRAGRSIEELVEKALSDDDLRYLIVEIVETAATARDVWIIDRCADLFLAGVDDPARVDELLLIKDALRQLEPLHVRALKVMIKPGPHAEAVGQETISKTIDETHWTKEEIAIADPVLSDALDPIIGRLLMIGMVAEGPRRSWFALTPFGRSCVENLVRRASRNDTALPEPTVLQSDSRAPAAFMLTEGIVIVDGHDHSGVQLHAALIRFLRERGVEPGEAHDLADRARFDRTWYAEGIGIAHDCAGHSREDAHETCYRARRVVVAANLPASVTPYEPRDISRV